jgi:prefoldin subunit 5
MKNIQSALDQKVHTVEYYDNQLAKLQGSINLIVNSDAYQKIKDR